MKGDAEIFAEVESARWTDPAEHLRCCLTVVERTASEHPEAAEHIANLLTRNRARMAAAVASGDWRKVMTIGFALVRAAGRIARKRGALCPDCRR
ncbi:MAG TPA: hypothetical protein VMV27_07330 [Candidatus Binataceae bacterium]|nr:hypothetical protein [Candidatus Binataceae bacterium]